MFVSKVRNTIKQFSLLKKGDRVLVAVSGGPDSLALLYALYALSKEYALKLYIAHLDHGLRKESRKEREFVLDISKKLHLQVIFTKVDLSKVSQGASLEELARNKRQEFFFRVAKKMFIDKIALGHNLDDQAETVLMRIIRGTGLYGISAILPKRKIQGFVFIRPLLGICRKEILRYLAKKNIRPCWDKTNLEEKFLRNKIRHTLLPLLEKFNPQIKQILANLANTACLDYAYLLEKANQAFQRLVKQRPGGKFSINSSLFNKTHPAIRRLVLRLVYAKLKGDTRRLSLKHIQEIEDLFENRPAGSLVDLPSQIRIVKNKKRLLFYLSRA